MRGEGVNNVTYIISRVDNVISKGCKTCGGLICKTCREGTGNACRICDRRKIPVPCCTRIYDIEIYNIKPCRILIAYLKICINNNPRPWVNVNSNYYFYTSGTFRTCISGTYVRNEPVDNSPDIICGINNIICQRCNARSRLIGNTRRPAACYSGRIRGYNIVIPGSA